MKTLHFTIIIVTALILSSCNINLGEAGNGNIITQERNISEEFTGIKSSTGIDVYLTQGSENRVVV